ncbi:MAG: alpha/beta fold hydrolase [Pirellulales bacterium]
MKRVAAAGTELAVFDRGSGPVLLFVHGFPLDHTMWAPQLEAFTPTHRVLAPDLRGFGASGLLPEAAGGDGAKLTMEGLADDLALLLDALGVREPVTLCGLSMGGYIAWEFVRKHRGRLARLVLCDTRAAADSQEVAEGRHKTARRVLAEGSQVVADAMLPKLFSNKTLADQPRLVEQIRQVMLRTNPQTIAAALLGMAERPDSTSLLSAIDLPTLLIVGAEDAITPAGEMRAMAHLIPAAHLVVIDEAGHLAPLENPSAVNSALEQFLAKQEATRSQEE